MKDIYLILVATMLTLSAMATDKKTDHNTKEQTTVQQKSEVVMVSVAGTVLDQESREALAGAAIVIDGQKIYSDLDGHFDLPQLPQGVYKATVYLISYQPISIDLDLQNSSPIVIALKQE